MTRFLALLLTLLTLGCSSGPERTHPFTNTSLDRAVGAFGEQVHGQTAMGWGDGVPQDDGLPLVRVGELVNQTDLDFDPRAFMAEVGARLAEKGYVVVDDEGVLVVRGKLKNRKFSQDVDPQLSLFIDQAETNGKVLGATRPLELRYD